MKRPQFENYIAYVSEHTEQMPGIKCCKESIILQNRAKRSVRGYWSYTTYRLEWVRGEGVVIYQAGTLPHAGERGLEAIHKFEELVEIDFSLDMGLELLLEV